MSADIKYGPSRPKRRKYHDNQYKKPVINGLDQSVNNELSQSFVNDPSTSTSSIDTVPPQWGTAD